eukprot:GFUD01006497.1.p1 GENE.GFUD01006497.1~~GFUD01006497.1.p1  ORF type:complete len:1454 (-),score=172.81 GFUD01006497.1:158-4519(-)
MRILLISALILSAPGTLSTIVLKGGSNPSEGDVFINGYSVWHYPWNSKLATVACRMLGYKFGFPTSTSFFGSNSTGTNLVDISCNGTEESLLDCTYSTENLEMDWGAAGVRCKDSNELLLELQGGSVASEGNVFIDGLPISGGTWKRKEANTVCRLLGYKHGIPTTHSKFGPTSVDPVHKVECNGSEKLLSDCTFSGESYYKAAGVVCLDSNELKVELSGGHGPSEGNVLVNGKPVCEWNWDKRDALVTCRMLGFPFGFPSKKSTSDRKNQIYDSMFSKWGCKGTEDSLFDCPFTGDSCNVFNDAGVDCKGYDYGANMTVRLESGFVPSEGNLLLNDQYVCGYKWSSKEASTACRMLGYKSGYPARQKKSKFLPPPPNSPIPYLFSSVKCSEEESSLLDCMYEYRAHGSTCRDGYSVAGVSCFDTETIEVLELQGGQTPMEGDVFLNGRPICEYGWNSSDAAIVCRTLGYKFGAHTTKSQYDDNCLIMRCKGDEDSLFKCEYYTHHDGDETAGVLCSDTPGPIVEMRGGFVNEGNVYTNKRAVCATGWGEKEAAVICRMKGYSHGYHTRNSFFGRVDKSHGYSEVVCDGTETSIANCTYKEKRYCDDYKVGGVICTNTTDTAELVELKGGTVPSEGNVYIMGRHVCWNWYGNWRTQADVVCRMLGFPSGFYVQNSRFGLVPKGYKWDKVKCDGSEESFFGCEFERRKKCYNDEVNQGVGVICRNTTNPTIELKGGTSSSEGNVFFGGEPICSDYWDSEDASVVCRMLGFKFGYPTNSSKFGPVTNKFIFGEMHCNGKEESLFDCNYNFVNCNSKDGAGAICKNTPPFSLELRGGSSSSQGKVFVNNRPICDYGWDAKDATVTCRTLGYSFGIPTSGSIFGNVPVDFIFKQVACNGSETSLANCGHDKCTDKSCGSYCYQYDGAGVICQNTDNLPIELRGGNSTSEGNVFVNGKPVCDEGWGVNEAAVTCRLLGFQHGFAATNSKFGSIPNISFFGDVRCVGTEDSLFDCNYNSDTCSEKRGAGVICQNNTDFLVELRGGSVPSEGNVFVNNKPVCDYRWNAREASVVCRMFGYPFGFHTTKSRFGPVPDLFIFEDVFCHGSEQSLEQCGYGGGNCKNPSGAGVICLDYDYAANATIELRGGSVPSEGNVYINDKPVCDNGWNWGANEGITACHMLGYVSGIHTSGFTIWKDAPMKFEKASYSLDQGKASLDNVNCNGPQKSLFDCEYYLEKQCKGGARGVICLDSRNLTLELRGGSVPSEGNLFVNGKPVCDDGWGVRGAIVACRMLGYAFGTPTNESRFGSVPEVFILKNVNCQGYEESLLDCSYSGDNCKAHEGAGVVCQSAADLTLDLTGWTEDSGLDGDYGGNVVFNGETVCDSSWDDKDANVVCRILGYSSGTSTTGSKFGPGLPHIITAVECNGNERSLLDCKYWAIDDNRNHWCGKDRAAGVVCRK